ncbi:MAG: hypothetical protein A2Y71_00325 [Bacteroidetes bacterium RBG_13_42_15]|nr:MAG: hypothetical protein A2Y71_00325 [Bacteroidetes bacterium RBG_13_42_15]
MMMNNTRSVKRVTGIIVILTLPLLLQIADGQGADKIQDDIARKFAEYCRIVPWEEVYIHTDRDEYIAGETMWFNTLVIERPNTILSGRSRVVYFEVLNRVNRPVVRKRVRIDSGSGPGMVFLPDTLSSGDYIIRAYTNWMKNFLPSNCFSKKIRIFNAINITPVHHIPDRTYLTRDKEIKNANVEIQKNIKADVVSSPDTFYIQIRSDNAGNTGNTSHCYLFIQTHGIIDINKKIDLLPGNTEIVVPKKNLTPGINHITLFNDIGIPFFERYILTLPDNKQELSVESDISSEPRSKAAVEIVPVELLLHSSSGTRFSIAITPASFPGKSIDLDDYLIFGSEFGIIPEQFYGRKLREIDDDSIDEFLRTVKSKWIDWKVIMSGNLPEIKYLPENENHYITGRLINIESFSPVPGKYVFISSPGKNAHFMYDLTDKNGDFSFPVPMNSNRISDIIIQPERSDSRIAVNIASSFSELYSPLGPDTLITSFEIPAYLSKMSVNYQLNKIYGSSSAVEIPDTAELLTVKKNFYGKTDLRVILDDYIKLPVMEEVFFELVPGVNMRRDKSGYEISILDPVDKRKYNMPPGLFVDGIKVDDATVVANLDPELVEQIDVVLDKYFVGDYLFYGIVNIITRAANFSNVDLPEGAVRLNYRVTDPAFSFVSPDFSIEDLKRSRIPDLRNTLYWNPSVVPGDDGKIGIKFWTSDYNTDFQIDIQGITSEGKPVSSKKFLKAE